MRPAYKHRGGDSPLMVRTVKDLPAGKGWRYATKEEAAAESVCLSCVWGCRMTVEMIVDHWNPSQKRYRTETFCYGPKSCSLYRAGPTRKVPGRKGMSWEEEDWVDKDATSHRAPDE